MQLHTAPRWRDSLSRLPHMPPVTASVRSWDESNTSDLLGQWRALTSFGRCAEPFFQPEWFRAFHQAFAPQSNPLLVTAYHGKQLLGILPLVRSKRFLGRIPATTLHGLSNVHSCRFDLLHDGSRRQEVSAATWLALKKRTDWDVIEARDVPADGNFKDLLARAREDGHPIAVWPTRKMPFLPLSLNPKDPFANCPERFKGSRSRLRSKERKLQQEGPIELTLTREANQEILRHFFELEASGWKGAQGSAISLHSSRMDFYTTIAALAAEQGTLRLYSLTLGGRPIAMHFGLTMNGVYYIPKVAYDEKYKKFSPGLILAKRVIETLTNEGATRFDFLGPRMEWKCVWTSHANEHANCFIFQRSLKGRALKAAIDLGAGIRRLKYRCKGDPQEI